MPKVKIPTPLRQYTAGNPEVEVGGATAGEALGNLASDHPDLRQHLYTGDGKLRSFVTSTRATRTSATSKARTPRSRKATSYRSFLR